MTPPRHRNTCDFQGWPAGPVHGRRQDKAKNLFQRRLHRRLGGGGQCTHFFALDWLWQTSLAISIVQNINRIEPDSSHRLYTLGSHARSLVGSFRDLTVGFCISAKQRLRGRANRRPGAIVPPRNGLGGTTLTRKRNRSRQTFRGRPLSHDRGTPRQSAFLPGPCRVAGGLIGGNISLREIVDLDASYIGPDAKAVPTPEINADGGCSRASDSRSYR